MCLIIDCNSAHKVFPAAHPDFVSLSKAIDRGDAKLVCGGKLKQEYQRMKEFWRYFVGLDRQGRTRLVSDSKVDAETLRLQETGACTSDDHHIVALARVSGARLLCSDDNALCNDFKNRNLLARPRGNIYRRADHAGLLRKHCKSKAK
jgi:hypothetical protein